METPPSIDGITQEQPKKPKKQGGNVKLMLLLCFAGAYAVYILWSVFLMMMVPNPEGTMQSLVSIGTMIAGIGGLFFFAVAAVLFLRLRALPNLLPRVRVMAMLKVLLALAPGLAISGIVPLMISREIPLTIDIVDPPNQSQLVAPITIVFSLERAVSILGRSNLVPQKFSWDFEGDGKKNDETVNPTVSALYEKAGVFQVAARIEFKNGQFRRVTRTVSIPDAVFSVLPQKVIVDETVSFSVKHLETAEVKVREVQWDFNNDGEVDETIQGATVTHTFLQTGEHTITAVVLYQNQSQKIMKRTITVNEPEPLPFPVSIKTQPEYLLSPVPFGVLFTIETEEPHREVLWNFGDGEEAVGDRVGHTFKSKDVYRVTADVRSLNGSIAKISKIVRVVDLLSIPGLNFDGEPKVTNNKISGEVPLTVNLTPKTNMPLVECFWEAPDATVVESTKPTLRVIYRRPGNYVANLLCVDPSGGAMRLPLNVEVNPPSSVITFRMNPSGGVAPLMVQFDASETTIPGERISGFEWAFGEEESEAPRQRGAREQYVYKNPGTYIVTLRVITESGQSFETSKTIVIRAPILDACFQLSKTPRGTAPFGIGFNMSCTSGEPASIEWNFGDGSVTDERNPKHSFDQPGTYKVILRITGSTGDVNEESVTITVTAP